MEASELQLQLLQTKNLLPIKIDSLPTETCYFVRVKYIVCDSIESSTRYLIIVLMSVSAKICFVYKANLKESAKRNEIALLCMFLFRCYSLYNLCFREDGKKILNLRLGK